MRFNLHAECPNAHEQTEWTHVYLDVYECRCCGARRHTQNMRNIKEQP